MAQTAVNDVVSIVVQSGLVDGSAPDTLSNRFMYRRTLGAPQDVETELTALKTAFLAKFGGPLRGCMITTYGLKGVVMTRVAPEASIGYEFALDINENGGALAPDDGLQCRTAVISMRNTQGHRLGRGRKFVGPVPATWCNKCLLNIGDADVLAKLTAMKNVLDDTITDGTATYAPVICPAGGTVFIGNGSYDVRVIKFAPYISYLKTRRMGRGS